MFFDNIIMLSSFAQFSKDFAQPSYPYIQYRRQRGRVHKVSRSTAGHNFFIFDRRALNFLYVGANGFYDKCTKFQVRSFILKVIISIFVIFFCSFSIEIND